MQEGPSLPCLAIAYFLRKDMVSALWAAILDPAQLPLLSNPEIS